MKRAHRDLRDLILGRGVPLGDLPAALAAAYKDHPAIRADGGTPGIRARGDRTFAELEADVARLAAAHFALGLTGQRVALLLDNRVDTFLHVLALARVGAIAVPVNPRLRAAEIASVLAAAHAVSAIADGSVAARAWPERPHEPIRVIWTGAGDLPPGAASLGDALDARPPLEAGAVPGLAPDDVAVVLATSGTTGRPKAAELTSRGLLALPGRLLVFMTTARTPLPGPFRVLMALPLAHVMGLSATITALCAGALVIHRERFEPGDILRRLAAKDANIFAGVPTMYADLEAPADAYDLSGVHLWVSAADAMPADRARRFQRRGSLARVGRRHLGTAVFADVYGMVELSGPMALRVYPPSPSRRLALRPLAVALAGFEARAVDDAGQVLRPGRIGQLEVRGPGVLRAYGGEAALAPGAAGWFATGDLARVWPGGFIALAGRSRDRLKVGGFSVFPAEVEAELGAYAELREVALVGVPDERLGEAPVALVVPRDAAAFAPAAFLSWAAQHLAGYRRPRAVVCLPALPRGNNGKVDRAMASALAAHALAAGHATRDDAD